MGRVSPPQTDWTLVTRDLTPERFTVLQLADVSSSYDEHEVLQVLQKCGVCYNCYVHRMQDYSAGGSCKGGLTGGCQQGSGLLNLYLPI